MFKGPAAHITIFVNSYYNNVVYTSTYSKNKTDKFIGGDLVKYFLGGLMYLVATGSWEADLLIHFHLSYSYNILKI